MTTCLQNTKRRHRLYMHRCSQKLGNLDAELEEQLLGEYQAQVCIFKCIPFQELCHHGVVPSMIALCDLACFWVAISLPG